MSFEMLPDIGTEHALNIFLKHLVDELKMWFEQFNYGKIFKLALICTGCDIPAKRKCGFLGQVAHWE
ncbi:hypothetical protein MAR_005251, partial [Mya arenaria]